MILKSSSQGKNDQAIPVMFVNNIIGLRTIWSMQNDLTAAVIRQEKDANSQQLHISLLSSNQSDNTYNTRLFLIMVLSHVKKRLKIYVASYKMTHHAMSLTPGPGQDVDLIHI